MNQFTQSRPNMATVHAAASGALRKYHLARSSNEQRL
jgi:hypothetical protein